MAVDDTEVGSVAEGTREKDRGGIAPDWALRVVRLHFTWPYQNMDLMRDIGKFLNVYLEINHCLLFLIFLLKQESNMLKQAELKKFVFPNFSQVVSCLSRRISHFL